MDQIVRDHSRPWSLADKQSAAGGVIRRCARYAGCVAALMSVVWGPAGGLGQAGPPAMSTIPQGDTVLPQSIDVPTVKHEEYLAAGFGFQSASSALITIKTYHVRTGTILSEESFDLNVKEDGMSSSETQHGRIFAGGIGVGPGGPTRFLLRAYDAVTGRFLWEGQLSFGGRQDESNVRPIATVAPLRTAGQPGVVSVKPSVQVYLSLRAMDSRTGRIVWEDRFIPGVERTERKGLVRFNPVGSTQKEPMAYVFDLVVRALDPKSARLLWQDSFEDDEFEGAEGGHEKELQPQTLPAVPRWKNGPAML